MKFMTREGVTFLTKKDFDVKSLITILKEQAKLIEKNEDQKILKQILMLLEKNWQNTKIVSVYLQLTSTI